MADLFTSRDADLRAMLDAIGILAARANNVMDVYCDSRGAMLKVSVNSDVPDANGGATAYGLNGFHPLNWVNALTGNRITLGNLFAKAGERSDQYLERFDAAHDASRAGWAWYNHPVGNDIGYAMAGYVDRDGIAVTTANVAALAFERLCKRWEHDHIRGKKVVVLTEPGATNFDAGAVRAVHEFNLRLKCWAEDRPWVTVLDFNPILWSATASATQIRFKANFLQAGDTIHLSALACYAIAKSQEMQGFISRNFQYRDRGAAAAHDVYSANPLQIIRQPFQLAASGGVLGANITLTSGTIPGNLSIKSSAAASVVITQADTAGDATLGKAVSWDLAMGPAGGVIEITADSPSTAYWTPDRLIEFGVTVDVAAHAAGANVYGDLQINTGGAGGGTWDYWALYTPRSLGKGPTEAYTLSLKSEVAKARGGVTPGYLAPKVCVALGANETCKITTRNWWGYLRYPPTE